MKKLVLFVILASPLFSDYIILENGESHIGDIETINDEIVVIETINGKVTVPRKQVTTLVKSVSVVSLYKEKKDKAKTAQDHYDLSQWCFKNGYPAAGDLEYAEAIKIDPSLAEKKTSIKPAKTEDKEKEREKIMRRIRLRKTLNTFRYTSSSKRKEECIENLKQYTDKEKQPLFIDQLGLTSKKFKDYRSFLLDELSASEDVRLGVFIGHLLKEPDSQLRDKTISIIKKKPNGMPSMESVLITTLLSDSNNMMANLISEQTLGKIRSKGGVAVLVKRLVMIWGPSTRAHFARFTQHAYVRDVTPVVAAGATSFDPELDTYKTGIVLEAKILSVEREIIIYSLQQITGQVLPGPKDWITWWKDKGRDKYGIKIQVGASN
ncbi:hypothetical protein ACFL6F_01105 [Planctomycetota bacterium]